MAMGQKEWLAGKEVYLAFFLPSAKATNAPTSLIVLLFYMYKGAKLFGETTSQAKSLPHF